MPKTNKSRKIIILLIWVADVFFFYNVYMPFALKEKCHEKVLFYFTCKS